MRRIKLATKANVVLVVLLTVSGLCERQVGTLWAVPEAVCQPNGACTGQIFTGGGGTGCTNFLGFWCMGECTRCYGAGTDQICVHTGVPDDECVVLPAFSTCVGKMHADCVDTGGNVCVCPAAPAGPPGNTYKCSVTCIL